MSRATDAGRVELGCEGRRGDVVIDADGTTAIASHFEFERPHAFLPCPLAGNLTSLIPFPSPNAGQAVDIKASKGASGRGPAPVGRILPQQVARRNTAATLTQRKRW